VQWSLYVCQGDMDLQPRMKVLVQGRSPRECVGETYVPLSDDLTWHLQAA
jgi:hypothetical protein